MLLLLLFFLSICIAESCDFFIAKSRVLTNGNVGLFAGKKLTKGVSFPPAVSLLINKFPHWQLQDYVYKSKVPGTSMVEFGPSMMFNHHETYQVNHDSLTNNNVPENDYLQQLSIFQPLYANSLSPKETIIFTEDVDPGNEIFTHYGNKWFILRNITPLSPTIEESTYKSVEELEKVGHCLSNIYTNHSKISSQESPGEGVFASINFKKGDFVDVSPVLVLPKYEVTKSSDSSSVLINFCFSRPGSDVALLPIGYGAVCNHGGKRNANVAIEWFFWEGKYNESLKTLMVDPKLIFNSSYIRLFFGYRALRDIKKDEEILIDYGDDWESEWEKYIQAKQEFKYFEKQLPLFRRAIDLPESMFPKQWYVVCIEGYTCSENDLKEEPPEIEMSEIKLKLLSLHKENITVYWSNDDNHPVVTINETNSVYTINTYEDHDMLFKNNNYIIGTYKVKNAKEQYLVISSVGLHVFDNYNSFNKNIAHSDEL